MMARILIALLFIAPLSLTIAPELAAASSHCGIYSSALNGTFVGLQCYPESGKFASLYRDTDSLSGYLNMLFKIAISVGAILAVMRLAYAGYLYMGGDMWGNKQRAREMIQDVFIGLLLLLSIWVILNQINPNILSLSITTPAFKPSAVAPAQPLPGRTGDPRVHPGPIIPSEGCRPNCVYLSSIPGRPATKPGICGGYTGDCQIERSTGEKLAQLNKTIPAEVGWQVTEAWPPKGYTPQNPRGIHSGVCHATGTCVDAGLIGAKTADKVNTFLRASRTVGLCSEYEVKSQSTKDALVRDGVPASSIKVYSWINGDHFSVYNDRPPC